MRVSSPVPSAHDGKNIVEYLASRFTYLPAATWRDLVQEGRVSREGRPCTVATRVAQGDVITCDLPDVPQPAVNLDYTILYEDPWLLAVNKPPNLRVHSTGRYVRANLIYHLRHEHEPPYPEANLVNRLDAGTSGVVLLARDASSLRRLSAQFREGSVAKRYLALVHGQPDPPQGLIELPIGPSPDSRVRGRQVVDGPQARPARTRYETLRPLGARYALVALTPETGRTHQLRLHLAANGHPLLGDALYQMDDDAYLEWAHSSRLYEGLTRPALHGQQTAFIHPASGERLQIEAPLPADMRAAMKRLSAAGHQP